VRDVAVVLLILHPGLSRYRMETSLGKHAATVSAATLLVIGEQSMFLVPAAKELLSIRPVVGD
jgi:hypothetical protein